MIDLQKDITLVLGIDAKTIEQLRISWPTWKKHRAAASQPNMWDWPLILFFDRDQVNASDAYRLVRMDMDWQGPTEIVAWPPPTVQNSLYESQRERMLTGHVYIPALLCQTLYHMKLDTDALARPHEKWIEPQWFDKGGPYGTWRPAYVAPKWNYTKGAGWLGRLEDWGDGALGAEVPINPPLQVNAPLGCRSWPNYSATAKRVGHSRMCSWCSYYSTDFTKTAAMILAKSCGEYKLPIPSQDTTMWYIAERCKLHKQIVGMKSRGWSNHPRVDELRRIAAEIMAN